MNVSSLGAFFAILVLPLSSMAQEYSVSGSLESAAFYETYFENGSSSMNGVNPEYMDKVTFEGILHPLGCYPTSNQVPVADNPFEYLNGLALFHYGHKNYSLMKDVKGILRKGQSFEVTVNICNAGGILPQIQLSVHAYADGKPTTVQGTLVQPDGSSITRNTSMNGGNPFGFQAHYTRNDLAGTYRLILKAGKNDVRIGAVSVMVQGVLAKITLADGSPWPY